VSAVRNLLIKLTKVYVEPYIMVKQTKDGPKTIHVDAYWRSAKPGENLEGKTTMEDPPTPANTPAEHATSKAVLESVAGQGTDAISPPSTAVGKLQQKMQVAEATPETSAEDTYAIAHHAVMNEPGVVGIIDLKPDENTAEVELENGKTATMPIPWPPAVEESASAKAEKEKYRGWTLTPLKDEGGELTGQWGARAPFKEDPMGLRAAKVSSLEEARAHVDAESEWDVPTKKPTKEQPFIKNPTELKKTTGASHNLADFIAQANDLGITVPSGASKVDVMDLIRQQLGTFDPQHEKDPAKAQDLKHKIDWNAEDPFKGIEQYLNDDWVAEPKLDGARFRIYLGKTGNTSNTGRRSLQTMKFTDRTDNFPQFRDTVVPELAGTVLDGEILAPDEPIEIKPGVFTQGTLNAVMSLVNINPKDSVTRQKKHGKARFVAFDVTMVNGEDVTGLPYTERRKMLEMIMPVLAAREPAFQMAIQMPANRESINLALAEGMEGVMLKKKDGKYVPGQRMASWQKIKRLSTADFFIVGSVPGKGQNAGKVGSLKVAYAGGKPGDPGYIPAVPGKHPAGIYVADVAGFDQATRQNITDMSTGAVKDEMLGKVLEVSGQGRTKGMRIRHPVFVRWRDDKAAEETDATQFELFEPI
jgi:bifunctional non-homologous end joining protein LigD